MLSKKLEIINKLGLHARASSQFVTVAQKYESRIFVEKCEQRVDGKSMMNLLLLAAAKNSWITLEIFGEDEQQAMQELVDLINNKFGEGQ